MLTWKRVLLRAMEREDLFRLWQFNNDVQIELSGGGDPPIPQSLARLVAEFDQNASRGGRDGGHFAIEVEEKFIGQCALFNFTELGRTCELGITIGDPDYLGKGYGREAVHALLDYAFRLRNTRKVFLNVNGDNERAIRAYKACGFVEEARWRNHIWSNGRYIDLLGMGVFPEEWRAKLEKDKA